MEQSKIIDTLETYQGRKPTTGLLSDFCRKRISNGVQTEWNLRERDFRNKRDPEDLEWKSRNKRGSHEGARRTPHPRGPLERPTTYFFLLYIPTYPENIRTYHENTVSTTVTFCIHEIPSWSLRRRSAGGGIDHGGLLHQHHSPSDELWVVYHRPSGP